MINRKKSRYFSVTITAFVMLSSLCMADWQASSFKTQTRKAADKVELISQGERSIINVLSSDGIGSATITRIGGEWPTKLVLRLNLRNLEFIRISNQTVALRGRLGGDQWSGEPQENAVLPASIRKSGAAIEVEIPELLLQGNPAEMKIEWIDAYRQ